MIKIASSLSAIIIVAFCGSVRSQSIDGVESMRTGKGRCKTLQISGASTTCNGFVYAHFHNGRTAWNFATHTGAVMLSGGKDQQPSPERYRLDIDKVRITNPGAKPIEFRVAGMCESILSTDGVYLRSVECRAQGQGTSVIIDFIGDGHPVSRVQ